MKQLYQEQKFPKVSHLKFVEMISHGTKISSEEALRDITPVEWSEEVLNGKYRGQIIIRSSIDDYNQDGKSRFMYQQNLSQIGKINFPEIVLRGTKISSEEALRDITPVEWSQDVLVGKYRGKTLIKAKTSDNIKKSS